MEVEIEPECDHNLGIEPQFVVEIGQEFPYSLSL